MILYRRGGKLTGKEAAKLVVEPVERSEIEDKAESSKTGYSSGWHQHHYTLRNRTAFA